VARESPRDGETVERHDRVPAPAPNASAAVIVNASEIEKLAATDGMRSMAMPLARVSRTRMRPSGAAVRQPIVERPRMAQIPATATIPT
jgi:hypothetical protein